MFKHMYLTGLYFSILLAFQNTSYQIIYFMLNFIKISIFLITFNYFTFFTYNNNRSLSRYIKKW